MHANKVRIVDRWYMLRQCNKAPHRLGVMAFLLKNLMFSSETSWLELEDTIKKEKRKKKKAYFEYIYNHIPWFNSNAVPNMVSDDFLNTTEEMARCN